MNSRAYPNVMESEADYDVVCFSHLRWDFVYQRPQHLLSRFAKHHRVFFIEEPIFCDEPFHSEIKKREDQMYTVVPYVPHGTHPAAVDGLMRELLKQIITEYEIGHFISWYYTPMMLGWSEHLEPAAVVYDCMDELSAFKNAPHELRVREAELMSLADVVFTGGQSLYESKKEKHRSVFCFPSSIDADHFAKARDITEDPTDQAAIPHPRVGYFGVIDERADIELLGKLAELRPEWHFVMIGPVVKIDVADLPKHDNIHYLGGKSYNELPNYIAGWDVAMMPFALNESTKFISPTKTPEYLAAGAPVVSTPIRDVIRPYAELGLVHIAETPESFAAAIEDAMKEDDETRRRAVNEFLEGTSWDKTYSAMAEILQDAIQVKRAKGAAEVLKS